jgi:predicted DNA binding CopG/RHH family protein
VKLFEVKSMIIDDNFDSEEYVTVDFTHLKKDYSITFKKSDLEIINSWDFADGTSVPVNLSDELIESIREEVKKKI